MYYILNIEKGEIIYIHMLCIGMKKYWKDELKTSKNSSLTGEEWGKGEKTENETSQCISIIKFFVFFFKFSSCLFME